MQVDLIHAASGKHARVGDLIILRNSTRAKIHRMPTSSLCAYVGFVDSDRKYREVLAEQVGLVVLHPHRTSLYDDEIVEHKGLRFRVNFRTDMDHEAPWESGDCYGIVSEYTDRAKRPGERVIGPTNRHGRRRLYDWQGSMEKALEEGWNHEPYTGTKRECAARAVQADYDYHHAWLNDEWNYVVAVVHCLDTNDEDACGGVETYEDYHMVSAWEIVEAMADNILQEREEARIATAEAARAAEIERAELQSLADEMWSLIDEALHVHRYSTPMADAKKLAFNRLIAPAGVAV